MGELEKEFTNSFRRTYPAWRSSRVEMFSQSSRDEEALKWAVLEKLPTFNRLRKGILLGSQGASNEVDVADISCQERPKLIDRLVKVAEEDKKKFLMKFKNRVDRFENVEIEAEAYVGSRALPTFLNFFINIAEDLLNALHILPSKKRSLTTLDNISRILKPSR